MRSFNTISWFGKEEKLVSIVETFTLNKGKIYSGYEGNEHMFIIKSETGKYSLHGRELFLTQKEYRKIRLKNLLETI